MLKHLGRSPAFTLIALATLALGIGAGSAMFSVIYAVILRPLPYPAPDRLVTVWQTDKKLSPPARRSVPPQVIPLWSEQSTLIQSFAGYTGRYLNLSGTAEPERVIALLVTAGFFPTLGVAPAMGRNFTPQEEKPGNNRVAILTDALWRRRFGADPHILGRAITLDGIPYTVIGVLPERFRLVVQLFARTTQFDVYVPISMAPLSDSRAFARLRPGVKLAAAQAEMDAIAARLERQEPRWNADRGVLLAPMARELTAQSRPALLILFGAAGCVLLIVCVNLSNLTLARMVSRRREMAVRAALGAGRWRLARQVLAETTLLSLAGGAAGLLLAFWLVDLIRAIYPGHLPRLNEAGPGIAVFGFGLAVSVVAGLLFGLLPAVQASRAEIGEALKLGGVRTGAAPRRRTRNLLIMSEVALALVLAGGAGLLLRSYLLLQAIDPGFRRENILTMQLWLPDSRYHQPQQRTAFAARVLERVQALPPVMSAGFVSSLPLAYEALESVDLSMKGHAKGDVLCFGVTPGYFQAMGIALRAGRFLREGDTRATIVNEAFARRYQFTPAEFVGQQIGLYGKPRTVVGVVANLHNLRLQAEPDEQAYLPYSQLPTEFLALVVRTGSDPLKLAQAIHSEIFAVDRDQPVGRIQTMEQVLSGTVAEPRFNLALLGAFALMAVALAAVGIYGVVSHMAAQSTHETGVRMALGAEAGTVVRLMVRRGMVPVLAGIVLGAAAALAANRLLRSVLYGVGPGDPVALIGVSMLLGAVALAACYVPARRAARIDPTEALRHE